MKTSILGWHIVAIAAFAVFTTNCSPKKKGIQDTTIDIQKITTAANLTNEEKAERLALAAEMTLVLLPDQFKKANDILAIALTLDPKNLRANLYYKLTRPAMLMKGIGKRVRPMLYGTHALKDWDYDIANINSATTKAFLLDGPEDISLERTAKLVILKTKYTSTGSIKATQTMSSI